MNHNISKQTLWIALLGALAPTASFAFPGAGPGGQLDFAARNLTSAAQNLLYVLQSSEPNSPGYQEAQTLVDATQLFQDRVESNPDDLGNDFSIIESTFDALKQQFLGCHAYGSYDSVRNAWVNVEQANLNLRLDWLNPGQQGGGYPPPDHGFPPPNHGYPPPDHGYPDHGYPPPDHGGWDHHGGQGGGW